MSWLYDYGYFMTSEISKHWHLVPLLLLSYSAVKWLFNYVNRLRLTHDIIGLPIIPFLGNLLDVSFDRDETMNSYIEYSRRCSKEPFFTLWTGPHLLVIFHKADHLEFMLSNSKVLDKSFEYSFLNPWLKTGLLTSTGDKWLQRRRMITPTFHFEILNDFLQVMNEQSEILVDILDKLHREGKPIDIFHRLGLCTLDIIGETAMGQNVNAQLEEESEYVKAVAEISYRIFDRMNNPLLWPDLTYFLTTHGKIQKKCLSILHGFTRKVIMERSAEFERSSSSVKRLAFLDMLLKTKVQDSSLTFDDIQEEVDTFMFEGHDTTTAAASWAFQMIGSHPDVQNKLHHEIDQVLGSTNRQLTSEDLGNLKYLECVIKETLRLFPSVPFFLRTVKEDQIVAGKTIPKGSSVSVFSYMVHRDERYFPDPERFDPDRFLPENSADRHPFAYIPFSAGKRNCIGQRFAMMEEKVIIANVLRRFEIKALKPTNEIVMLAELILKPKGGIQISVVPRQTNF